MQIESQDKSSTFPDQLKQLLMVSAGTARHQSLFMDKEELNYYKSFPEIADKHNKLVSRLSSMVNRLGSYVGVEPSKGLVKIDKTVEILDQYSDNIEIILKKAEEEEQKLKLKKKKEGSIKPQPPRPQKLQDLSHPERTEQRKPLDNDKINLEITVTPSKPLSQTKLTYIDTSELFSQLIETLKGKTQIAVDLQHSDKSYYGFTCLMQLSTRDEDYIVDVLKVWKEMRKLNVVFNNPDILKVFHGANMDMLWLHRDFDLRVSNLFDTYQAGRQLSHKQLSYAYLLRHYTGVETDKSYQMADWRIRPLTEQMLLYARMDTHYLLQIYDKLKKDLFQKSVEMQLDFKQIMRSVFSNSSDVANITFKEMGFRFSEHYLMVMERHRALQPYEKVQLMDKIFEIRDQIAKQADENADEIFPRKFIFELSDKKNFDYPTLAQSFRKAPQLLQRQTARIANTLDEFVKSQVANPQNVAAEQAFSKKQKMEVQKQTDKKYTRQIKIDDDLEELYFEFDKIKVKFVQYPRKSLHSQTEKKALSFENPFQFLMNKYQIKKQEPTQITQEQNMEPTRVQEHKEEEKQEEILYFNQDKKRKRGQKPAEAEKAQDSAFKKTNKKVKREIKKQQKIRTATNHFSYLE